VRSPAHVPASADRPAQRTLVHSMNPTGIDGREFPHMWAVVTTSFGSGRSY
jgi:hypothetical protein